MVKLFLRRCTKQEKQHAERETQHAERETQRAERLAAMLRKLGHDPDQ